MMTESGGTTAAGVFVLGAPLEMHTPLGWLLKEGKLTKAQAQTAQGYIELTKQAATVHGRIRKEMYRVVRHRADGDRRNAHKASPLATLMQEIHAAVRATSGRYTVEVQQGDLFYGLQEYLKERLEGEKAAQALRSAQYRVGQERIDWTISNDPSDRLFTDEQIDEEGREWEPTYGQPLEVGTIERGDLTIVLEVYADEDGRGGLEDYAHFSSGADGQDRYYPGYDRFHAYDRTRGGEESLGYREESRKFIYIENWDGQAQFDYYRKQGMAKGPAYDKVWSDYLESVAYVEKCLKGDVQDFGCVATAWRDGERIGHEAACWGFDGESSTAPYIVDSLIEEADEAEYAARTILAEERAAALVEAEAARVAEIAFGVLS